MVEDLEDNRSGKLSVNGSAPIPEVRVSGIAGAFTKIWMEPRVVIRYALTTKRTGSALLFASVYGAVHNLHLLWRHGIEEDVAPPLWQLLTGNIVSGAVLGIGMLYVSGYVLKWVSRVLGVRGSASSGMIALGWAAVPYVPLLILAPLIIVAPASFVFHGGHYISSPLAMLYFFIRSAMTIWFLVIGVVGVSEAFSISNGRAFLCLMACAIVFAFVVMALTALLVMSYT